VKKVNQEIRVESVHQDVKVISDPKDYQERWDLQEVKVKMVPKVRKEKWVLKVNQAH